MIKKLYKVRKAAMFNIECSGDDQWSKESAELIMLDRILLLFLFWFAGSLFLLVLAIFQSSLEAFAGFVLSIGWLVISGTPFLFWYIKKYERYLGSED